MSRSRYEPVPQRDEIINMEAITSIAGYNYNSGVPNSVASSVAPSYNGDIPRSHSSHYHAPSIRSIPTSPPPSFHTHSSPGTPRPTPSTTAPGDYAELWGVAPSTIGGTEPSTSPYLTISSLQTRILSLEETIGRLLLEKDEQRQTISPSEYKGGNCCMSFTDASKALEEGMSASGGNCCIYFKNSKRDERMQEREKRRWCVGLVLGILFMFCVLVVVLQVVHKSGFGGKEGFEYGEKGGLTVE